MTGALPKILNGASGLMVVDADINAVSHNKDFGRIEATVTLYVKQQGRPLRPLRIRTNVASRAATPARDRLVADAAFLAETLMSRRDHAGLGHAA